jgi:hypothetical protein
LLLFVSSVATPGAFAGVSHAQAPALIRLTPASASVSYDSGAFAVRAALSGLEHHGSISYDDNRDTVADRQEPSEGLGAYELTLRFDATVLEVSGVETGTFLGKSGRSAHCIQQQPEPGVLRIGCLSTGAAAGPQGSGILATTGLRPIAHGTSTLTLEAGLSGPLADDIPVATEGAVIEVSGGPEPQPEPPPLAPEERGPRVIDGSDLGSVSLPPGDPGPAMRNGGVPRVEARTSANNSGVDNDPFDVALLGTGYVVPGTIVLPVAVVALIAAGVALIVTGTRVVRLRR